jgi:hypothetical protein
MKKAIKKNGDKKEILIELNEFVDKYQLEGDISVVADYINSLPTLAKDRYPENNELQNAHRFVIRHDTESDYYGGYNDIFHLQCYRWETDAELASRIELNKKRSAAAKEREKNKKEGKLKREKTLYENLKKKFEGV